MVQYYQLNIFEPKKFKKSSLDSKEMDSVLKYGLDSKIVT